MRKRHLLTLLAFAAAVAPMAAASVSFDSPRPRTVVATLELASKGADWGAPGREAAVAQIVMDGRPRFQTVLFAGARRYRYRVFVDAPAGRHEIAAERDAKLSAAGAGFEASGIEIAEAPPEGSLEQLALANAPVLYARPDTMGQFSDVPMLVYCEHSEEQGRLLLQYTVILSNEDGGTSTRALMARWGRTTDIEYVYRAYFGSDRKFLRATIQAKDHHEIEFSGEHDGSHPVLYVATRNNMVAAEGERLMRFQIAPVVVDLSAHSREEVMDADPITYDVAARELARERKLRPFGVLDGEHISDPRNYLYFEEKVSNTCTGLATLVRLKGERRWRSSHLGRADFAISRDGWVRTTVELPPGAKPEQIAEIGFECVVAPGEKGRWPESGECRLDAVSKAFFLDREYRPQPAAWSLDPGPGVIPAGQIVTYELK